MPHPITELISADEIQQKVKELAEKIHKDHTDVFIVVVLTGAMVFFADLLRELNAIGTSVSFSPIKVSSYEGTESTGDLKFELDLKESIKDKHVLIVEDIVDTGLTVTKLKDHFAEKGAASVQVCALLDKKARRSITVSIDYVGFDVPDKFLVGYGLDFDGRYRELPYVGIIGEEGN
ncbi:MAG: hypoxanthine phosphoribosyltransferase [archaeon]